MEVLEYFQDGYEMLSDNLSDINPDELDELDECLEGIRYLVEKRKMQLSGKSR